MAFKFEASGTYTAAMTEGEATTNGKTSEADEISDLDLKIVRQVEYYFGDYNLPRDKFMQEEIKNDDGWISLETMIKFKRLASLSTDKSVIVAALKKSTTGFIEVHESGEKIRRSPSHPLPVFNDEVKLETVKRTVYCKGFPKDGSVTLDDLLEYFQQFGPYETVRMRYFFNKGEDKQGFKGSVLVVFPTVEKAEEFKDKTEVKFKSTYLIRKWYEDYMEEKKKEIDERRAKKEARKKKEEEGGNKPAEAEAPEIDITKGTFLHFFGLAPSADVTREDLKEALGEFSEECAWIGFSRGMTKGYLRFREQDFNKEVMEKMGGKLKVKDVEATFRIVEGEEEEDQIMRLKEARSKCRTTFGKKRKSENQGRGGGFQYKKRK